MGDRDNAGTLARNKKRENDRQPEFRGSAVIDGVSYWVSAWVKEGEDGKFFSLAFTAKEKAARRSLGSEAAPTRNFPGMPDSDIPFAPETR